MNRPSRWLATALSVVAVSACAREGAPDATTENEIVASTVPYTTLDNVEGDYVNLNPTPVRPMIRIDADDGAHIYAANIPNNTIGRFDGGPTAGQTFRTLVSPVALAYDAKRDLLLVVAQHSDAVVAHDRTTGVIRKVIGVPNEPADIVIVGRSAFVSSNAVQRAPLGYGPRG